MIDNSKRLLSLLFSALLVAALGACSTVTKYLPDRGTGAPERSGSGAREEGGVYYTGSSSLPLHKSIGGAIITQLPQYTKLYRDQLDRGFAHVRVESTGETGWVENAKLLWRLPTQNSSQAAHEAASKPAVQPSSPPALEAAASPSPEAVDPPASPSPQAVEAPPSPAAVAPSSTPSTGTLAPSIFNPY